MLDKIENIIKAISLRTAYLAQIALVFATLIIVANVILRRIWKPVPGTVEMVEMSGAILLGMAVAYTTVMKGHIRVDVLVEKFSARLRALVDTVINAIVLCFTIWLTYGLVSFGINIMQRGYTTGHLLIPVAPSYYLLAFGFTIVSFVILLDLMKSVIILIRGSEYT